MRHRALRTGAAPALLAAVVLAAAAAVLRVAADAGDDSTQGYGGVTTTTPAVSMIYRSSQMGVHRCVLEGVVNNQAVLLYLFLTACRGGDSTKELYVTGQTFMRVVGAPVNTTQLEQPQFTTAWAKEGGARLIYLRSIYSSHEYPLPHKLHLPSLWPSTSDYRREPGRMSAKLALAPEDEDRLEFQVLAYGFNTLCTWHAASSGPPAWPGDPRPASALRKLNPEQEQGGAQQAEPEAQMGMANLWPGPPVCGWHLRQIWGGWGTVTPGSKNDVPVGNVSRVEPEADKHVYLVLSPFFDLPPHAFATLLVHHMRYHERLGVTRYLIYLEERGVELAEDPRIQVLVREGKVRLILWEEVPHYMMVGQVNVRHPYGSQSLVYNHALLTSWAEGGIMVFADLDEYLITQKRMTIKTMFHECAPPSHEVEPVVMWIPRHNGYCPACMTGEAAADGANASSSNPADAVAQALAAAKADGAKVKGGPTDPQATAASSASVSIERSLWLAQPRHTRPTIVRDAEQQHKRDLAAAAAMVHAVHPLTHYTAASDGLPYPKTIAFANVVAFFHIHKAYTWDGIGHAPPTPNCAVWLHLRTQLQTRPAEHETRTWQGGQYWVDKKGKGYQLQVTPIEERYLWVLQDLAKQDEELHVQGLAATGLQQLQQMRHAGSIITDAPDATSSDNNAEQQQAAASSTADVVVAAASSDSNGQPQAADGSQQQQASGVNPARRALLTRKLHHL